MTSDTQTRINLTALQRRDPYIVNIIDSATHVAVYTFNPTSGEWEKTEIEGTLFVYSRVAPPTAGFTIMNQLSMENLTEPLNNELEFQNQSPFLLYRNSKMLIYGIWFYDMYDCSRIGNLLLELSKGKPPSSGKQTSELVPLPSSPTSTSSSSVLSLFDGTADEDQTLVSASNDDSTLTAGPPSGNKQRFDIMEILSKAKKDYDKINAKTSEGKLKAPSKISKADLFKPVPVKSDSKKVNVASLFDQSDSKKAGHVSRPSSANPLNGSKPDKSLSSGQPSHTDSRFGSRSMSLSLSREQFQGQLPGIVNGAIRVEELESPVLGMSAQRNRLSSVNDASLPTGTLSNPSPAETNPHLHKLIVKTSNISLKNGNSKSDIPHSTSSNLLSQSNAMNTLVATAPSGGNRLTNFYQRSLSTPIGSATRDPLVSLAQSEVTPVITNSIYAPFASSNVSTSVTSLVSTSPSLGLPTLHENFTSQSYAGRTMSSSSSLPQPAGSSLVLNPPLHVAASLHGTTGKEQSKLLSPSAMQLTKSSKIAASLLSSSYPRSTAISPAALDNNKPPVEPKTLISPDDFEHSSTALTKPVQLQNYLTPATSTNVIEPLNKKQLADVLCGLLQDDSSFIDTVHQAYISGYNIWHKQGLRRASGLWK